MKLRFNSLKKFISLVLIILFGNSVKAENNLVDLVIYSYDRPLQLYALLESLETYVEGAGQISVICKATNTEFENAYAIVAQDFPYTLFFIQDNSLNGIDFKPLVEHYTFETPNDYVSFIVDDVIVTDYIDLCYCVQMLKKTGAYGFFLRNGKNTNYSFMGKRAAPVPPHQCVKEGLYIWQFLDGIRHQWNYPNNVDFVIYKKSDIKRDILSVNFKNPQQQEANWQSKANPNLHGLFFDHSKMVNVSMNLVREDKNWAQFTKKWEEIKSEYTPEKLLEKFNQGLKIDISKFYQINNNAPHMESEFVFIKRNPQIQNC